MAGSVSPRNRARTARAPSARCAPPPPTPPPRAIGAPPRHHRFSGRRASVGSSGSSPRASPADPSPRLKFRKAQRAPRSQGALLEFKSRSKFRPHSITRPRHMGLFPPGLGKFSAPQGPTGCAPGASLLANAAYYGGEKTNSGLTHVSPKTARCIQTQQQATTLQSPHSGFDPVPSTGKNNKQSTSNSTTSDPHSTYPA